MNDPKIEFCGMKITYKQSVHEQGLSTFAQEVGSYEGAAQIYDGSLQDHVMMWWDCTRHRRRKQPIFDHVTQTSRR